MSDIHQRLQAFVQHAYANSVTVKRQLDDAGVTPTDILTVADLDRIPILPKDEVIKLMRPHDENEMIAHTVSKLVSTPNARKNVPEVIHKQHYPELEPETSTQTTLF